MSAAVWVFLGLAATSAVLLTLTLRLAVVHIARSEDAVSNRVIRAALVPWAAAREWRRGHRAFVAAWAAFALAYATLQAVALGLWGT